MQTETEREIGRLKDKLAEAEREHAELLAKLKAQEDRKTPDGLRRLIRAAEEERDELNAKLKARGMDDDDANDEPLRTPNPEADPNKAPSEPFRFAADGSMLGGSFDDMHRAAVFTGAKCDALGFEPGARDWPRHGMLGEGEPPEFRRYAIHSPEAHVAAQDAYQLWCGAVRRKMNPPTLELFLLYNLPRKLGGKALDGTRNGR